MKLSYDAQYLEFQNEVREFLNTEWDGKKARDRESGKAFVASFRKKATERGYIYRGVPKKYGGGEQPADVMKAQIISEEFARARAPKEIPGNGINIVIPTLLEMGSDAQKERFIEKTVLGEYKWAQGYSEPSAGSDLASLRSKAELIDGEWVINGHKIWTTRAQEANYMFALLRTEPDAGKHAGLSYILFDFKQPGVTISPIKQINGGEEFCETFLDDVRTPEDWVVGGRGNGWAVSRVNMKHERNAVGSSGRSMPIFRSLIKLAKRRELNGRPAIEDPRIRQQIARIEGYIKSQLYSGYYQNTLAARGESAGVLGMTNKITTTNILQSIAETATEILGETALLMPPPESSPVKDDAKWLNQVLGSLALAIAGGTANIQRNIIAERGLELPRSEAQA